MLASRSSHETKENVWRERISRNQEKESVRGYCTLVRWKRAVGER